MSDWIVASKKSGKRGAKGIKTAKSVSPSGKSKQMVVLESDMEDDLTVPEAMRRLDSLKEDLKGSLFYQSLREILKIRQAAAGLQRSVEQDEQEEDPGDTTTNEAATVRIVAFGIGRFASSEVSLLQFALLLCLLEDEVGTGSDKVKPKSYIFDPMCGEKEQTICSAFNIETLKENTNGKFDVMAFDSGRADEDEGNEGRLTLFYMPHCPYSLYGNVLWRNWENLSNLSILGNSFESYSLRRETGSPSDCDCVRLLHPFVTELEVWDASQADSRKCNKATKLKVMENAFNDLSLMFFGGARAEPVQSPARPAEAALDEWNRVNDPEAIL